jgi:hypothetical protein
MTTTPTVQSARRRRPTGSARLFRPAVCHLSVAGMGPGWAAIVRAAPLLQASRLVSPRRPVRSPRPVAGVPRTGPGRIRTGDLRRPARAARYQLRHKPMRLGPASRTRCLLLPRQAGWPSPPFQMPRLAGVAATPAGRDLSAVRCGVLNHQVPGMPGGCARAAGVEPATRGFGDRCSSR